MIKEFKFTNYFGEDLSITLFKDNSTGVVIPSPNNHTIVHDRVGICYDYHSLEPRYDYFDKYFSIVNLNYNFIKYNYYGNTYNDILDFYQILSFIYYCRGLEVYFTPDKKNINFIRIFNGTYEKDFDSITILISQDEHEPDYNIDKFKQFLNKIWEEC